MKLTSRFVRACLLGGAALFLAWPGTFLAGQPGKPSDLYTVAYDVGDMVAKKTFWDLGGQRMDVREGLARSLLQSLAEVSPGMAKQFLGKQSAHSIQLVSGKTLEVHTDKKTHEQVKNLLEAFRRLLDLAVVVECGLYEVDRKVYDQQVAGKLNRLPGNPAVFADPATDEFEKNFLEGKIVVAKPFYEGMKPLKTSKVTIQDRERGEIFSWRTAVPYERSPDRVFTKKELAFAFPGFSFSMTPVVSSDRRKVHIQLTQKVTQLLEWKKEKALMPLPNQDFKEVEFEVPVLQESSFTGNFTNFDGSGAVAAVQAQKPGAKGDERVLLLVFSARILIEEEERLIREALEKEKNDKK
jgi:hypothetical protein